MTGGSRAIGRRALLGAVGGLLGAGLLGGCSRPADPVVIAAGPTDTPDLAFARLLAAALDRAGHPATALITSGNLENVQAVGESQAHLGICTADTIERRGPLVALAQLHQRHLHLVTRGDSGITAAEELRDRRIAVPPRGVAGHEAAIRVLAAVGAGSVDDLDGNWMPMEDGGAARAVAGRRVEAMIWAGALPPADVAAVEAVTALRALDLSAALTRLRPANGTYQAARLPAAIYHQSTEVATIAIPTLLVCHGNLPHGVASTVVDLLLDRAEELVPASTYGLQYLSPANLIDTAGVELHFDAVRRYRVRYG
ncbi:TAXI family TRAP transporter solute-binding subunit [Naumannella halotolerans]|uniref:TAXI family TRAP transporter solute-binding subunit n=1 Tax=Naumannella halotolerans TaxID=993414 RepID=UPI00370D8ADD